MGTTDIVADALERLASLPVVATGRPVLPEDRTSIEAARLLGHARPHARTPTEDLVIEGEYALRRLAELGEPVGAAETARSLQASWNAERGTETPPDGLAQLRGYFHGVLDGIAEEVTRRLRHPEPFRTPARIAPEMLERIRAAVPCQEFIQWSGHDLRPAGSGRWKRRCPLGTHRDSEPSFVVYADHWWCYGCGQGGDVFAWARRHTASFVDAVRAVAAYAGIDSDPRPRLRLPRNA